MPLVSKSRFMSGALKLFRQVERTGTPITITDRGKPVLQIVPCRTGPTTVLVALRGTVVKYRGPMKPIGVNEWEANP